MSLKNTSPAICLLTVLCALSLAAIFFPLSQDEAYYFAWAQTLQAGYFDHPPAVAWLASLGQKLGLPYSPFAVRFGGLCLSFYTGLVLLFFYRLCGLTQSSKLSSALLSCLASAGALVGGFLTTPDSPLLAAWASALYFAFLALKKNPRYWLAAGVFTGLGLLAKFTMLLIGPVFLLGLIAINKAQLKTPWPYLGGLVALLIFSPNLHWNQTQDWITWKFQLRHGLALDRQHLGQTSALPKPRPAKEGDVEFALAKNFQLPSATTSSDLAWLKQMSKGDSLATRLWLYGSGQLALWGVFIFVFFAGFLRQAFRRKKEPCGYAENEGRSGTLFLLIASLVPLVVFGLFALKGKVEANWGAMYLLSAAPLLSSASRLRLRTASLAGLANLALLTAVISYTNKPFIRINPGFDRILQETHGYKQLATSLDRGKFPLFADTYQLASQLRFYTGSDKIAQWPGLTRSSEFVRAGNLSLADLEKAGGFRLVTSDKIPAHIEGFTAFELERILDCREGYLEQHKGQETKHSRACSPIHSWWVVDYKAANK